MELWASVQDWIFKCESKRQGLSWFMGWKSQSLCIIKVVKYTLWINDSHGYEVTWWWKDPLNFQDNDHNVGLKVLLKDW